MSLMKECRDCSGEGGEYPIVEWKDNSQGYAYPILSEIWQDCQECEGTGEVVDHDAFEWAQMRHDPLSDRRAR